MKVRMAEAEGGREERRRRKKKRRRKEKKTKEDRSIENSRRMGYLG